MRSTSFLWVALAIATSVVHATQTVYDIAAALESLAFQTYAVRPIVQNFTQTNVALALVGQGPIVVRNDLQEAKPMSVAVLGPNVVL